MDIVNQLVRYIGERHPMQEKYLEKGLAALSAEDREDLEKVIEFFAVKHTIEEMGEAYLVFVKDTINETKYFVENDYSRYRYATLSEVNGNVYQNEAYMSQYMLGLQLSGYLWDNHRQILHWFREEFLGYEGKNYLEIGPGHGQYFAEAMNRGKYENYYAIDLSKTSLDMTKEYVQRFAKGSHFELVHENFYDYDPKCLFDAVCVSEVLEHVEDPYVMIKKIVEITGEGAHIYINVPVNAPAIDHIYLYRTVDEVKDLVQKAGLKIIKEIAVTGNGWPMEKAIKHKSAINYAVIAVK
ncbi:MAG: class I SAM-dependent methyltransferase [Lachnospiraceae bacterium]|nr:class I SAM-dependent methyltransferase [Lachnospiraceae bacterium]